MSVALAADLELPCHPGPFDYVTGGTSGDQSRAVLRCPKCRAEWMVVARLVIIKSGGRVR